jgi:hypothetical protein
MGYIHLEVINEQISKKAEQPSGDVIETERDNNSIIHILCDGAGSGIKANITATMYVARMKELIKCGFSVRQAFANTVQSMEETRKKNMPCAFFTVVRVLNEGAASILTYDMPDALFVAQRYATPLKSFTQTYFDGLVGEADCSLNIGEGILVVSDGIVQAGLGKGMTNGWGIDGLNKFVNDSLRNGAKIIELPKLILSEAKKIWKHKCEDDCTVSLIYCRKGRVINILTGPPLDPDNDLTFVNKFLANDGLKIVCGATTAKIVARVLEKQLEINPDFSSMIAPPSYEIDGIDLVTEGAVTLNQLYNIWGEDLERLEKKSPVTAMSAWLNVADRINFFVGKSENPAGDDISFKQSGILARKKIVELLIQKFREDGKFVYVEEC